MKIKKASVCLILVLSFTTGICQPASRLHTTNNNGWLMYFGNHKISQRVGLHAEIQFRRYQIVKDDQQLLLRTGLDYYLKDNGRFTLGYAFVKTYPYGEFAAPNSFPEHRIWQQFTTNQKFNKLTLSHRYRLEQRFLGNASTGEMKAGRFENRFRYMIKATYPITPQWDRPIFVAAYEELFLNFGKDVAYNIFDQNRLYVATGFTLSPTLKIEIGYLYQLVQLRSLDLMITPKNKIENNHTAQIGIFSNFSFLK